MSACPDLVQIVSYSCAKGEKFRMQKNKNFKGHNTAGYACGVNFSPDSRWVRIDVHNVV
jgi:pre-mRNA-processing factor 17